MAYELTFVQGSPGRNYSDSAPPGFASGSHGFSGSLTFAFDDDDALLHEAGADPTPATLLEDTEFQVGGRPYALSAGTQIALSKAVRFQVKIGDTITWVNAQGVLVNDGSGWKPIVPTSGIGYPGVYLLTNGDTASPDFGKPMTLSGNYSLVNVHGNRPPLHVPYSGEPDPTPPECFTPGALIDTPDGPRRVEALRPGDRVTTRDHGAQPLLWVGRRQLDAAQAADPAMRPIRIRAGALGPGCPARDLIVSPQHRLLLRSRILARVTGEAEVLTPACQLLDWPGIAPLPGSGPVTYLHLMCPRHEVIRADGAWTETLLLGRQLRSGGSPMAREIARLFPVLMAGDDPPPARPLLRGRPLRALTRRAARNRRALVEDGETVR